MKKLMTACTIAALTLPLAAQAETTVPQMKTTMMTQSSVEGATSSAMSVQQTLVFAIIAAAVLAAMSRNGGGIIEALPQ